MGEEDQLAAQLTAAFRQYKQREAAQLVEYYGGKLLALEAALLDGREALFTSQEVGASPGDQAAALTRVSLLEMEVAELRQIKVSARG